MAWDWSKYAVDGATRPDSFTGLRPEFASALEKMFASAPPEILAELRVMSGYRSPERQKQLWDEALKKYGSPEAARKWVAPPGNSQHNHGNAVDLRYLSDAAREWAHANAGQYGMTFPMSHEPWHIELAGARAAGPGHHPGDGHDHSALGAAVTAQGQPGSAQPTSQPNPNNALRQPQFQIAQMDVGNFLRPTTGPRYAPIGGFNV